MNDLEVKTKEFKKRLRTAILSKECLERTIISLGLYGRVSGVIGPYIVANLNGRMIIRLRPKNFRISQSTASIENRKSMASANKFAMFLKNIYPIYEVWGKVKTDNLNPFTRLIKHNKKHLIEYHPSPKNVITPEGHSIIADNLVSAEKKGKIKISNNYRADENEKLVLIIVGYNPRGKGYSDFECIELNNSLVKPDEEIKLTTGQKNILRNYSKFILYYALVRKEGKNNLWSNTYTLSVELRFDCDYELAEAAGYGQILFETLLSSNTYIAVKPPG